MLQMIDHDVSYSMQESGDGGAEQAENLGVSVRSETTILDQEADVWLALTGDQCAITNIRITHAE